MSDTPEAPRTKRKYTRRAKPESPPTLDAVLTAPPPMVPQAPLGIAVGIPKTLPPILTLYRVGDVFFLHLFDEDFKVSAAALNKSLTGKARTIVVSTPTSTTAIDLNGLRPSLDTRIAVVQNMEREPPENTSDQEPPSVAVNRERQRHHAGVEQTCQRCQGTGQILVLLDGGQSGTTFCPICKGQGTAIRFDARGGALKL